MTAADLDRAINGSLDLISAVRPEVNFPFVHIETVEEGIFKVEIVAAVTQQPIQENDDV